MSKSKKSPYYNNFRDKTLIKISNNNTKGEDTEGVY